MKTLYAKITFTIDENHPDFKYVNDPKKELNFIDIYTDKNDYYDNYEQFESMVKSDLMVIAGGGYSTDHVNNVKFDIFKATDLKVIKENKVQKFMDELKARVLS